MEKKYNIYTQIKKFFIIDIFGKIHNKKYKQIEHTTLGKIANIKMGFTPSTQKLEYWEGCNKWLSISDLKTKYVKDTSKKISDLAIVNKQIIKKGTLVMSFKLTLGKLAILEDDMYSNEAICNFSWKTDIDTEYMYYYLNSIRIEKYGAIAAKGVTLNKEILNTIPIYLVNIEKQKEISKFLTDIDCKLDLLKKKLNINKEFKRSLLSKMFC